MAKYTPIDWKDEIKDTNGNLVQQGTPLSANNLKKMETGIASAVEQTEIVAAQLADTAKKSDLELANTQIATKASKNEVFTMANMGQDIKTAMTGGSVAVVGDGAVDKINLKDKAVTPEKTNFIKTASDNLIDKDSFIVGYSTHSGTGAVIVSATNNVSLPIPISPNTAYSTYGINSIHFYDITQKHIRKDTLSTNATFTTPIEAHFARLTISNTNFVLNNQFNIGGTLKPYDSYAVTLDRLKVGKESIKPNSIGTKEVDFLMEGTNLFNKFAVEYKKNVDSTTGELIAGSHVSSAFIPAKSLTDYATKVAVKVAYYDVNKNFIRTKGLYAEGDTFNTPLNTAFIRLTCNGSEYKGCQLSLGKTLPPYENHFKVVDGVKIVSKPVSYEDKRQSMIDDDMLVVNGKLEGYYKAPVVNATLDIASWTPGDLFALYDDLVQRFPSYITKSVLGTNGLGQEIYRYDFKPTEVKDPSNNKFPKIILISGVHGWEKAGIHALYQSLKQICENWKTDELLETLRWNVHFIVVPVVNIYGFINGTRKNSNGVDISRNFSADWSYEPDKSSSTYTGESPMSEKETQLLDALMRENKDAIYFGSFHNYIEHGTNFIWNAGGTALQVTLAKTLLSKVSRKWRKEYAWMPQDDSFFVGYTGLHAPNGSEGKQAVSHGIQGGTFEICMEMFLEPNHVPYSSMVNTLGSEAFINWLLINLKCNTEYYNLRNTVS